MSGESETPKGTLAIFGIKQNDKTFRTALLLWMAGIALLSVPMVTLVDVSIARWFTKEPFQRDFSEFLELTRVFTHGGGIFMILLGIMLMAPKRRWHIPRLIALALGAGAVATIAKMFVLRPRPNGLNLEVARYDSAWLWAFDWQLEGVAAFDASTRAFPSGSMATAVALTVGLWVVLPRGRWLFGVLCLGALIQRLNCGSHFMSDLFGGAAFGLMWSYACMHPRLLGSLFDKIEQENRPRRERLEQEVTEIVEPEKDLTHREAA